MFRTLRSRFLNARRVPLGTRTVLKFRERSVRNIQLLVMQGR
jgi:hypothetical protein